MATVETPNRINLNKDAPAKTDAPKASTEGDKPKVKAKPRDYSIGRRFSGSKDKLHKAIDEMDGETGTIFVVLGKATSLTTKGAMEAYGKSGHDLSGKYETVANSAFTEHEVKTEVVEKRKVTFS